MQALTFITMSRRAESSVGVREALAGSGRARLLAHCGDPDQLPADVLRLRPSATIIILEADHLEEEFALVKELAAACPDTAVITAARDASPALILRSMRSGSREFLQLPIIDDEFETVLDRVAELCAARESASKSGRVVAVFSGKGG